MSDTHVVTLPGTTLSPVFKKSPYIVKTRQYFNKQIKQPNEPQKSDEDHVSVFGGCWSAINSLASQGQDHSSAPQGQSVSGKYVATRKREWESSDVFLSCWVTSMDWTSPWMNHKEVLAGYWEDVRVPITSMFPNLSQCSSWIIVVFIYTIHVLWFMSIIWVYVFLDSGILHIVEIYMTDSEALRW